MGPGGGASKEGNNYEALWGVDCMLDVLTGKATSIRIEQPGVPGMEFYVTRDGRRQYWQCKEFESNSGAWTGKRLEVEGVLQGIHERMLVEGDQVVFASTTAAKELQKLEDEAKRVRSFIRFTEECLNSEDRRGEFSRLKRVWDVGPEEVFERLLRLTLHSEDKRRLRNVVADRIGYYFSGDPSNVLDVLRSLYLDSSMVELTADDLRAHLHSRGLTFAWRRPAPSDRTAIETQTAGFILAQRSVLIGQELLERRECRSAIERISERPGSHDVIFAGRAGGGKSAALLQLLEFYNGRSVGVLAVRLDRLGVESSAELSNRLGLSGSVVHALVSAFPGQETALVIDQLDALSALSGRMPGMMDVVEKLLVEVRGARREGHVIHLVLACRQVDLDHDHRLRAFQAPTAVKEFFDELSLEQVKEVLAKVSKSEHGLSEPQLALLRTPVNLRLFCEAYSLVATPHAFRNEHDLFDSYWHYKRSKVRERCPTSEDHWSTAIGLLVKNMNRAQALSAPMAVLDDLPSEYVEAMLSEGVLQREAGRIRFSHESFLDFCAARMAIRGDMDPLGTLLSSDQDLFWRSQVRQTLQTLRLTAIDTYRSYLNGLIHDRTVRAHIKLLSLDVFFSFAELDEEEVRIGLDLAEQGLLGTSNGMPVESWVAERAWESFFGSRTWLPAAIRSGRFDTWLQLQNERVTNTLCHYLSRQAVHHGDEVAANLVRWTREDLFNPEQLRTAVFMADLEHSEAMLQTVSDFIREGRLDILGAHGLDYDLSKRNAPSAVKLFAAVFTRWLALVDSHGKIAKEHPFELLSAITGDQVMQAARSAPQEFIDAILPLVLRMAEKTAFPTAGPLLHDLTWTTRWGRDEHPSVPWAFVLGCEGALEAMDDTGQRNAWVQRLAGSRLDIANDILLHAFMAHPNEYARVALDLFVSEPFRMDGGPSNGHMWYGREVLRLCTPQVDDELFARIEAAVFQYARSDGERVDYDHWTLASALPAERLSAPAIQKLASWREEFGGEPKAPRESVIIGTYSPVAREVVRAYTDDEWIAAMREHASDDVRHWDEPSKGGATELARLLEEFVKEWPERFYQLLHELPADINWTYPYHILSGLRSSDLYAELKLNAAFIGLRAPDTGCLRLGLDIVKECAGKALLDGAQFDHLLSLCDRQENMDATSAFGDDHGQRLLNHGINTIAGSAVITIGAVLLKQHEFAELSSILVERLVSDAPSPLLACALHVVCQLTVIDQERAVDLFLEVIDRDSLLLTTGYGDRFLHWALHHHYDRVQHLLRVMIAHEDPEMRRDAGRHGALVNLHTPTLTEHLEAAFASDEHARLGIAAVANANLSGAKERSICKDWLLRLFHDVSDKVKEKAARCFRMPDKDDRKTTHAIPDLVNAFLASPAFDIDPTSLLDTMDEADGSLAPTAVLVCERYLLSLDGNSSPAHHRGNYLASDLVFKCYHHLKDKASRLRVLDLIDLLAKVGHRASEQELKKYDR